MNTPRMLKLVYFAMIFGTLFTALVSSQGIGSSISQSLCGIVNNVRTIIGALAILLFIVGGVLYATAHMLPAAGNLRGNLQGWSMGMIVGAIVGIILVIIAPTLLSAIAGFGSGVTAGC